MGTDQSRALPRLSSGCQPTPLGKAGKPERGAAAGCLMPPSGLETAGTAPVAPVPGNLPLSAASDQPFSHREIVVIMLGLALGLMLTALDQSILATALPRISTELGGGESLSWVISA